MKIIHKTSMLKALKRKLLLSKKEPKAQTEHKHSPAGPGAAATSSFSSTDESSSGLFNSVQSFSSFDSYSDSDFETADFEEQPQLEKPTTIPELDYASVILHNHNDLIRSIVPAIMDHVSDYFRPTPEFKTKIDILFKYSFNEVFFLEHLAQHPEGDKETPEEKAAREKKPLEKKSRMAANIKHSLSVWHIFTKLFDKYRDSKSYKRANEKTKTEFLSSYFIISVLLSLKYNTDELYYNSDYVSFYVSVLSPSILLKVINDSEKKYLDIQSWQPCDLDVPKDIERHKLNTQKIIDYLEKKYLDILDWRLSALDTLTDIALFRVSSKIQMRAANHDMNELSLSTNSDNQYMIQKITEKKGINVPDKWGQNYTVPEKPTKHKKNQYCGA